MADQSTDAPGMTGSASFDVPMYTIDDPADQAIAAEIEGLDPFADIASAARGRGGFDVATLPGLSALSPALRAEVENELRAVPPSRRAESEPAAIATVLAAHGRDVRVLLGNGEGTNPYHAEQLAIARQHRDLTDRIGKLTAQAGEIVDFTMDASGNPQPVYAMSEAARGRVALEIRELTHHLGLLVNPDGSLGIESQRRLDRAMLEAVEARKAAVAQLEEHREAEKRADQILREERINAKAELLAKHRRTSL